MSRHRIHDAHDHVHGPECGHVAIQHHDHIDYAHDGHLHRVHDGHVDECSLLVDSKNPAACTPMHHCGAHDGAHTHGEGCGHSAILHGDHVDYLVAGHLHHPHGVHCDDHGAVTVI